MITKILDRLYVGDAFFTKEDLKRLGIGYVINVGGNPNGLENFDFHLADNGTNEEWQIKRIMGVLGEHMAQGDRVLVCCRAGTSRSCFIIAVWLESMGMDLDEAVAFIKLKHKPTQINQELLRFWRNKNVVS